MKMDDLGATRFQETFIWSEPVRQYPDRFKPEASFLCTGLSEILQKISLDHQFPHLSTAVADHSMSNKEANNIQANYDGHPETRHDIIQPPFLTGYPQKRHDESWRGTALAADSRESMPSAPLPNPPTSHLPWSSRPGVTEPGSSMAWPTFEGVSGGNDRLAVANTLFTSFHGVSQFGGPPYQPQVLSDGLILSDSWVCDPNMAWFNIYWPLLTTHNQHTSVLFRCDVLNQICVSALTQMIPGRPYRGNRRTAW